MFDHSSMMFPETAHFSGRVVHLDAQAVAEDPDAVVTEDVDKEKIRREAESWVIDETPLTVVEDVTIDESQFDLNPQQGLQQ